MSSFYNLCIYLLLHRLAVKWCGIQHKNVPTMYCRNQKMPPAAKGIVVRKQIKKSSKREKSSLHRKIVVEQSLISRLPRTTYTTASPRYEKSSISMLS
jgi:hypothetical protein